MKYIVFTLISSIFIQAAISQKFSSWNYQAECVDVSMNNATKIKVTNFDKNAKTDIDLEKKMALHAILFKGIAGGTNCVSQPPLVDKDVFENNNSYFKNLLGKKSNFNKYIISVEEIDSKELDKNKFKQTAEHSAIISINKDLLRKDLTNDKIIKSLNQGF